MTEKTKTSKFQRLVPLVALVLFLASPGLILRLAPNTYSGGRSRDLADRELRNRSAIAIILGEIRSSMSDMMFIKTELYLHSGVAYRLNLDYDALSSKGEVTDKGKGQINAPPKQEEAGHSHEEEASPGEEDLHFDCTGADTVIRSRQKDFRGFIGDLHRQVKPWLDPSKPHLHTDGTELLPWYRLMTMSDPHNIRGYMIGAWWLKRFKTKPQLEEALKFLEEGIAYNPEAFQLYLMNGRVFVALGDNQEAKKSYREAAERAVKQRPPNGKTGPSWTDYNEEDALASVRLAVMTEAEYGTRKQALQLALDYHGKIGQDIILERQIKSLQGESPKP